MYLNCSIPSVTNSTQNSSSGMKRIDLNNYYRDDKDCEDIHCQICDCPVLRDKVFEHTVSKRHKYNKLFVAISQNCSKNADMDFIVLSIDKLKCRLCETVITNSDEDDHVVSHIMSPEHMECKFLYWLSGKTSNADYKHLQPLDSLITHNKVYQRRAIKPVNKNSKKISLPKKVEVIEKDNIDQNILQYTTFCKKYRREKGEELPRCIIMGKKAICICTICLIEIPRSTCNVSGHLDGMKHKRQVSKLTTSSGQKVEAIDLNKKSTPEPATTKEIKETAKDSNDTHNIRRNDIPQCSAFLDGENFQSGKESLDCIIMGENGTRMCTVCVAEMPNTTVNIDEHVSGKKHRANMESKLQNVNEPKLPSTSSVGGLLDDMKHEQKVSKLTTSSGQKVEVIDPNKKSSPDPTTTKEMKETAKDSNDTHNIRRNDIPQCSAFLDGENSRSGKESLDCIIMGENGTRLCTVCDAKIPNSTVNIDEHVSGKKHRANMESKLQNVKEPEPPSVEIMCTTCGIRINNTKSARRKHKTKCKSLDENVAQFEELSTEKKLNLQDAKKSMATSVSSTTITSYICPICLVMVSNNALNIDMHNNGAKHKYRFLMSSPSGF